MFVHIINNGEAFPFTDMGQVDRVINIQFTFVVKILLFLITFLSTDLLFFCTKKNLQI